MTQTEKIKAEIDRLQKSLPWGSCASQVSMECNCKDEAYNEVLSYINSLEKEPVSNDLEEAATKYARKQLSNPDYPTYNDEYEMECAFEAGAQWQKERDQSTIELAEDHAYLAGQEKIIDKACEWLSDTLQTIVDVDCPSEHHVESIPALGSITQTEFLRKFKEEIKYLFD